MDSDDSGRTLAKILVKSDINKIPPEVYNKIEKFCNSRYEELITIKTHYNAIYQKYEKLRKDFSKLSSKAQDTEVNTNAAQTNLTELRNQLDKANSEIERLTNQVTQHESEAIRYRKERNDIMDERDQLQNSLDRNNATLQRLQSDIKSLETKLESAVSEKSSVLADLADMLIMEQSLDYKGKLLESEKERLNNEIIILTEKLKDSTTELLELRKGNTSDSSQLEAELKQKTEDLLKANTTIRQLTETNQMLTNQSEQNILKLKEQVDESVRLAQATVIEDLKRQLDESTDQCKTLKVKLNDVEARHQIEMATKDEMIENLKQELKMVETDTPETILEKLAPSAAAANRLLKGNLSLTEIYTRYYNVIKNVNLKDYECMKLKMELERVQSELNEKTLAFERQKVQYKKLLTVNEDLTQKVNSFIVEQGRHQEQLEEIRSKFGYVERENAKLKSMQKDLARQICYLLNEIQASGGEVTSEQEQSKPSSIATNPAIAKKLVTFKDIEEMQENNQKLLLKVRELSAKVEEMEEIQHHINMQCYGEKISSYEKQLLDAEQLQRADKELLTICLQQKERFKQLYYDAMKDFSKIDGQDKRASDEKMLQNKIKELKEEYDDYRAGSSGNFELLSDQFKEMQNKVIELNSRNCQLSSKFDVAKVKIKNLEDDIIVYKKLIETLEQRNQMYDKIIGKHELSIKHLTNEALDTIKKVSAAENQCESLQEECRRLINAKSNLERENQSFHRKNLHHSILQCDLEMMKVSSARLQFEGRLQMEQQLDKVTRECSDLRQKLDEEQNRLSEDAASLKRQAESAVKKMTDEQAQAEMLRSEIKEERKQIELKNQQINDLSKKLQEALTPCKFDNPIAKGNKKIKDLELQMKNKVAEIEKLKNDLKASITQATELSKQVAVWENKSKVECDKFETCKAKLMSDLQASQFNETNLKSQVEELQSEIQLQKTGSQSKVQNELKEALQKNTENNRELRDLRAECHKLKMNFETIELKYSNEMQLHSSDLQVLTSCKDELNKCREQIDQLRCARDEAAEMLKTSQLQNTLINKQANDNQLEFEERLANLTDQNTVLHDLLQAHSTKVTSSNTDLMNDSISDSSILNRTLTDDEINEISSAKLFSVIKYLRREKDISVAKIEILKTEKTRLLNEYEIQQKHLNELIQQRTADKSPANEANVVSASKDDELTLKVETLNAITDSNIRLRDVKLTLEAEEKKQLQYERDNLAKMFSTEKVPLHEEVNLLKSEKVRLEQDLAATNEKLNTTIGEKKEVQDEFNNLKLTNLRITAEITELKSNISKKGADYKAIQDELSKKDAELVDTNKKEIQIRTIAKKYKYSYFELKSKYDKAELATKSLKDQIKASTSSSSGNVSATARIETEKAQANKKDYLSNVLTEKHESGDASLNSHLEVNKKELTSHYEASSSNNVTTTQTCGGKRPRGAEGSAEYCAYNPEEEESALPQNKRSRLGEQKFNFGTVCDLEYQLPTSSQRDDENDDIMDAKIKVDDIENGGITDAEIDSRNEVESLAQNEEHVIDEYTVPNDTYEVDVDESSGAPNQSSIAASSGTRQNLTEAIETSPLSQETPQIQMISSVNDAQENTWTQVQRELDLTIQKVYEEIGDNGTVPSTPALYVACKTDSFSEAVSSSHHVVAHAFEGIDDMRMNEESDNGGQSSSFNAPALDSDHQEIIVVDLAEDRSNENNEADQKIPVGGVSGRAEVTVPQIMVADAENEHKTFDDGGASTSQVNDDKNVSVEEDPNDEEDVGTDGVSSEGKKLPKQDEIRVEENREAVALIQPMIVGKQGSNPIDEEIRDQQMLPQHNLNPRRAARRPIVRGNRETLRRTRR